jgi:phage terminase small subunit
LATDNHDGLTPKQEAFACAYVETGNASEAYRRSGYSTRQSAKAINENSSKLLTKVLPRVQQLQAGHARRHNIMVDSITEMLKADRELARSLNQPAVAVSASMVARQAARARQGQEPE